MDLVALLNKVLADKSKALQLVTALVDAGIGTNKDANVRAIRRDPRAAPRSDSADRHNGRDPGGGGQDDQGAAWEAPGRHLLSTAMESIADSLQSVRDDPDAFNRAFLNRPPYWSRQVELCRSIVQYRTTVAYSGNMVGKDYWIAGVIIWWLLTRPDSLCIITGPSQTVLGSVTFKEIRRCLEGAVLPFGGKVSSGIKASPAKVEVMPGWHCLGFSTTSVERSSGQHAKHLLAVVEEASGVEDFVFDAIDSSGYEAPGVHRQPAPQPRSIRGPHSPGRPRSGRQRPSRARRERHPDPQHGKPRRRQGPLRVRAGGSNLAREHVPQVRPASLWVGSHIDARIPDVDAEQLIPPQWLDWHRSQTRPIVPQGHPIEPTRCIACDLAEGVGRDSSCILVRDDWGLLEVDLHASAGRVDLGGCPPRPPTDPGLHITRTRFLTYDFAALRNRLWTTRGLGRP